MLQDEVGFVKTGKESVENFYTIDFIKPQPSSWTNYPSLYKFTGFELNLSFDENITQRETYDILEWMGDLGGLFEALQIIGYIIMAPITAFALSSHMANLLFLIKPTYK